MAADVIELLANWGEFIGGVAVVVSLIYVGVQLRSSVRQARMDSYTKVGELFATWTSSIYQSDDTAKVWDAGLRDYESLTPEQQTRFGMMVVMYLGLVDTVVAMERRGYYDFPEALKGHLANVERFYRLPGVQQWWTRSESQLMTVPHIKEYLERRE